MPKRIWNDNFEKKKKKIHSDKLHKVVSCPERRFENFVKKRSTTTNAKKNYQKCSLKGEETDSVQVCELMREGGGHSDPE